MTRSPWYDDGRVVLYTGDARDVLAEIPSGSVHCCVTSPPYWGLRDYGTAAWHGGDAACDHSAVRRGFRGDEKQATSAGTSRDRITGDGCRLCGARRIDAQLGLERSPDAYVAALVAVFREVRRVLRSDGTLWLNLGDSYNGYNGNAGPSSGLSAGSAADTQRPHLPSGHGLRTKGLKPKELVGIPWRVAFALQADGWYLRSDIIWSKPNPMPESVTDRPTKSHEYVFLLAKAERYYYDAEAVKERAVWAGETRHADPVSHAHALVELDPRRGGKRRNGGLHTIGRDEPHGRNRRSVWTINTDPFPGAHFAVFPPSLVKPCVLAGTSERGCCARCGAPWQRVLERTGGDAVAYLQRKRTRGMFDRTSTLSIPGGGSVAWAERGTRFDTVGWSPTCHCRGQRGRTVPAVVLDPFAGAGTALYVAKELGRRALGVELNPAYGVLAADRLRQGVLW